MKRETEFGSFYLKERLHSTIFDPKSRRNGKQLLLRVAPIFLHINYHELTVISMNAQSYNIAGSFSVRFLVVLLYPKVICMLRLCCSGCNQHVSAQTVFPCTKPQDTYKFFHCVPVLKHYVLCASRNSFLIEIGIVAATKSKNDTTCFCRVLYCTTTNY